jgi:hypothetical protein
MSLCCLHDRKEQIMRKFFTVIARLIASIVAILFVITMILALLLNTFGRQIFSANLYKQALAEEGVYERLPTILGETLVSTALLNPCEQNPLSCKIDSASPELQACLTTALGPVAYEAIGSGQRSPTDAELRLAQPCLDQYGSHQSDSSISGSGDPGDVSGMPLFLQNLTAANWQAILTILLPPDNLKTMTESVLDQMFAYLDGKTNTITLPLDKLKERITGPAGTDLIMQLINSQPPCTEQELAQMTSGTSNDGMVLCKPPEVMLPAVVYLLQELLNTVVPQIPDKAIIIKPPAPGTLPSGTGPFGADPITTIRIVRLIMRFSPLLPLAFLLLVTLFAVRSFKSWMRWWGIPILISGTIALSLGISALFAFNVAWTMYVVPRIPPFIPADMTGIGQELVGSIVNTISGWIILQAFILLAFGLAALIGSYFIKTRNGTAMPVTPPMPVP